ncbi:CGH_1_collapsed_G0015310.mRNA.1.CDS.1 [Saccharomyces cerevisiae]|nr:CGH_1_collapsed_G0015310.mRNA.1.CDS.1 [Saccharomyces cerevisiae]
MVIAPAHSLDTDVNLENAPPIQNRISLLRTNTVEILGNVLTGVRTSVEDYGSILEDDLASNSEFIEHFEKLIREVPVMTLIMLIIIFLD